jgi:Tol biopolymer transport system component
MAQRSRARSKVVRTLSALVATAAVGASLLALAAPAQAAYPGKNGSIIFKSRTTGTDQIYRLNGDGSSTPLTSDANSSDDPVWSPDGKKIAFDRQSDVWVMNADGSHEVDLTTGADGGFDPTWSPDGKKIAYLDTHASQIFTMNADGSNQTQLTFDSSGDADPAWSPDGTKIAFTTSRPGFQNIDIWTVNVKNGSEADLTNSPDCDRQPDWSPDGSKIVFVSCRQAGGNLWMMNADGSNPTPVGTPNAYASPDHPVWSPDGVHIVMGANQGLGSIQLWEVNPDGSGLTKLTNDAGQPYNTMPSWQPATPRLTAKPKSGAAGATVKVSGSGFALGEKVNLTFVDADGAQTSLGSATVSSSGTFITKVTIPATAPAGKSQIQAKESPLGRKSTAKFTVV